MCFAIGLEVRGGELISTAIDKDFGQNELPLSELYRAGIPICSHLQRRRRTSYFDDWQEIDGSEYLREFGFPTESAKQYRHQFYEFQIGGFTYVAPALVLMRAFFRPARFLLPSMFLPHALSRLCRLGMSDDGLSLDYSFGLCKSKQDTRSQFWKDVLVWMSAYPSAIHMAGSIHHHALNGQIGMSLPRAKVRMVLHGKTVDHKVFVTEISVNSFTPLEEPCIDLRGIKSTYPATEEGLGSTSQSTKSTHVSNYCVPALPDGTFGVTDQEWLAIAPILETTGRWDYLRAHSTKDLLSGILTKLGTGQPWRTLTYKTGNWLNARHAFRRWATSGQLQSTIKLLKTHRPRA